MPKNCEKSSKIHFRYLLDTFSQVFFKVKNYDIIDIGVDNMEKLYFEIPSIERKNSRFPLFYAGLRVYLPQHCLYLRPDPHGQGSLRPIFFDFFGVFFTPSSLSLVICFFDTVFLSTL